MTTTRTELYGALIALTGDTLLLPNAAVAEVVSPDRMERAPAGGPPWLIGRVAYNNRQLPVVQFEMLNGASRTEQTRRTRLAIVNAVTDQVRAGQYAIVCQGYPHLVTLNRTALRAEPLVSTDQAQLVLTRVGIANTSALIPDLESIEAALGRAELAAEAAA
jgi:chemosensory pili system protein ChpC